MLVVKYKAASESLDDFLRQAADADVVHIYRSLMALKALRRKNDVAAIFLDDNKANLVQAYEAGADDYVVMPCAQQELDLRTEAVWRRFKGHASPVYTFGALTVDPKQRQFTVNGQDTTLSPSEFFVLLELMRRGRATRLQLLRAIYGTRAEETDPKIIDVYVHRIRKSIEALNNGESHIQSLRAEGYCLRETTTRITPGRRGAAELKQATLLNAIKAHGPSLKDIRASLEFSHSTIQNAIRRAKDLGLVANHGTPRLPLYLLTALGEQALCK